MENTSLDGLIQIAKALGSQFGNNCEVVIHDVKSKSRDKTIVFVENGQVTHRKEGDGPSHVVLTALKKPAEEVHDHYNYTTQTSDGKILKSSTVYIKGDDGEIHYVFAINYDISSLLLAQNAIGSLTGAADNKQSERIPNNVNELLDDLIREAVRIVGKPPAMMTKADKVKAVNYLNDAGALLITKSSDRICSALDISKYSLYSYIDQQE